MAVKKIKLDVRKTGLSLGVVFALYHLLWVLATMLMGTSFLKWVTSIHFISISYSVMAFDLMKLFLGLVTAFLLGLVLGVVFAYVYNRLR